MRGLLIALAVLGPASALADVATVPWNSTKTLHGKFVSGDSRKFRFQVGCGKIGFILEFPWVKGNAEAKVEADQYCGSGSAAAGSSGDDVVGRVVGLPSFTSGNPFGAELPPGTGQGSGQGGDPPGFTVGNPFGMELPKFSQIPGTRASDLFGKPSGTPSTYSGTSNAPLVLGLPSRFGSKDLDGISGVDGMQFQPSTSKFAQ